MNRPTLIIHNRILNYLKHHGMESELLELVKADLGENTALPINNEIKETGHTNSCTISDIQNERKNKDRNKFISVSYQHLLQRDSLEWLKNGN